MNIVQHSSIVLFLLIMFFFLCVFVQHLFGFVFYLW